MSKKNYLLSLLGFLAILIFFCFTYYQKQLFMYPSLIHAWAQADRMSLAICFYDNGMNFLKPATLAQLSKEGVVGVEFPVQAYIVAALAHLFGRDQISLLFRLLGVLISCTGLLFLFLACFKRTKDFVLSILPPLFVFCSPVFIYYTCNYLPDTAGASMAFIAFYFVLDFFETRKPKSFIIAIFFLTLGTLIKTTVASYLAGFILVAFIEKLHTKEKLFKRKNLVLALVCLAAMVAVVSNYLHMRYLVKEYDSWLFLANPRPFKSWQEVIDYIDFGFKRTWINDYLVLPQYLMFVAVLFPSVYLLRKSSRGNIKLLLLVIYFVFSLAFLYLLGETFLVHDYYVIAIFFPFLAYALIISVMQLKNFCTTPEARISLRIGLLSAIVISFFFADFYYYQRLRPDHPQHSPWYRTQWLAPAKRLMTDLQIPKQDKIAVLDEREPNLSLVYFDRKGIVFSRELWRGDMGSLIQQMRKADIPWLVMDEAKLNDWLGVDSSFFKGFTHIDTKDQIAVFKLDPDLAPDL